MALRPLHILLLFAFTTLLGLEQSNAQDVQSPIANKGYYRTQLAGGAYLHTRGSGLYFRRGWRQTGFSNKILNIEVLTMRHPKEFKITNPGQQNTRGFHYGKINSLGMLRASFGWQKTLFDKEVKRGVRVSQFFLFGPTIAFVKPVFLEVDSIGSDGNSSHQFLRYDYNTIHTSDVVILGRAPILYGLGQTRIRPGIHVKYALNFEYSPDDAIIKAIETGINFDAFGRKIPIMANTYNDQFFLTLYIAFHFGQRYI